jgi:transcriptional accessory protein Tex/SPT6
LHKKNADRIISPNVVRKKDDVSTLEQCIERAEKLLKQAQSDDAKFREWFDMVKSKK